MRKRHDGSAPTGRRRGVLVLTCLVPLLSLFLAGGVHARVGAQSGQDLTVHRNRLPADRLVLTGPANYAHPPSGEWVVPNGSSLQEVLYRWCQRAGWTLVWNSEYVYTTQAGTTFKGDFLEAVNGLFSAMATATPKLYVSLYKGNRAIVVTNVSPR